MKLVYLLLLLATILLTGCFKKFSPASYTGAFDQNAGYYHAVPLHSDSIRSAVYGNFAAMAGGSNYMADDQFALQAGIHRSHNFGKFQGWYGGSIAFGSYDVKDKYRVKYTDGGYTGGVYTGYRLDTLSHSASSKQSFGNIAFNGGLNYVLPFRSGHGEWRFGIQVALQNEFGNYLSYRKNLPDTVADFINRKSFTKQLGFSTEWVRRKRTVEIGYQFSMGILLTAPCNYLGDSSNTQPFFISNTIHLSKGRITGFCQLNAGVSAVSFQTGINYRILVGRTKNSGRPPKK